MNLWQYPTKWWQYPLFLVGVLVFWALFIPILVIIALISKNGAAFFMLHFQALCYNPWLFWEE